MAFSGSGAASGAAMGTMIAPGIGTAIGAVAGGLLGGSKKKSVTLDPYAGMTPEQKQAMASLNQFGQTGQLGDFQAGENYDFGGFNYGLNASELAGGQLLDKTMGGTSLTDAQGALTGMVNAQFNPDDPSSGFAAFQRQLARSGKVQSDALNREAAIGGNRFGTAIIKNKADLSAQQSDIAASKLAELWQQTQANKLNAASGLVNINQANQNMVSQAFQVGQQQRAIQNEKAQASYDEWQRARNERLKSIDSLSTVLSKGTTPGLMSYDYKEPTEFQSMLNSFNSSSGSGGIGSIMSMFKGAGSTGGMTSTGKTSSFSNTSPYTAPKF